MIISSRVIILKDKKILFIHRIKKGREYYVLPGGTIEENESPEETAIREVKEETNFDIKLGSLLWAFEEKVKGEIRKGYYFLAKEFKGELKLGSPEIDRQSEDNQYLFEWIPFEKLSSLLIYPEGLKEKIFNLI